MFGSDSYLMSAYKPKNGPSLALTTQKPFAGFQQQHQSSSRTPHLPKSEPTPTEFESTIAQLWKSNNNNERFISSGDIWKFSPGNQSNPVSDYSSGLSEFSSPDDHTETFFNVATQLQRQTPPDQQLKDQFSNNDLADFFKPFETSEHQKPLEYKGESLVKNSLCCAFILNNQCERGMKCMYAHNILELGQTV